MDFTESLILYSMVTRPYTKVEMSHGLTLKEIATDTGLPNEVVARKLTYTGGHRPYLRVADPFPYVDKVGNRYRLSQRRRRRLITKPGYAEVFLAAAALSAPECEPFWGSVQQSVLFQRCATQFHMNNRQTVEDKVISWLVWAGYLLYKEITEEVSYSPEPAHYHTERFYLGLLTKRLKPKPLTAQQEKRLEAQLAQYILQ